MDSNLNEFLGTRPTISLCVTTPGGVSSLLASTHDLILDGLVGCWSGIGWGSRSVAARLLWCVCVVFVFVSICLFLCVYLSVSSCLPCFLVAPVAIAIHCLALGVRLRLPLLFCCLTHSDPSDWSLQLFSLSSSSSATVAPQQLRQA